MTKIIIVSVIIVTAACSWTSHDNETIEAGKFRAHRGDYEMLLAMLHDDKNLTFVNSGLTVPDSPATIGVRPARIAEYRRILSRLNRGALRYEPASGSVIFVADDSRDDDVLYFPKGAPVQAHLIEDDWYLSSETFDIVQPRSGH